MSQKLTIDINCIRAEFEAWRAQRKGRERIPEHLWTAVLGLLKQYPMNLVCRELKLSPAQVRERRQALRQRQPVENFLELTPRDLVRIQSVAQSGRTETECDPAGSRCRVVIERRDGSRLSLSLAGDPVSLQSLVTGFVRA